jgi:hypothetical protein
LSSDVIRIAPERLRFKLDDVADLCAPVWSGDWDLTRRLPLAETAKHRAIVQHFRDGVPWAETALFREIYPVRFARGELVHGCTTLEALAAQYAERQDALFAHLRAHGFLERVDGVAVKIPVAYLARDGEVILGNDGNHRVAMAKVLGLPSVLVRIVTRHPAASPVGHPRVTVDPELHAGAEAIPAMTTPSERFCFYRLTRAHATRGAVVELGTWLGAATVYMAAGMRDAVPLDVAAGRYHGAGRMHAFDRFEFKADHVAKAGGPLDRPMLEQVRVNLGPLGRFVELHAGEFLRAEWSGQPIAVLVADGPKRVREFSKVWSIFGPSCLPGAITAWQDFAFFPAYDLPACFARLAQAGAVTFLEGVYPGTTAVFRVERPILPDDVDEKRLRLADWSPDEIETTWERWLTVLPAGQHPRFRVGAALFLCDRGAVRRGVDALRRTLAGLDAPSIEAITSKWRSLRATRPSWVAKYSALDEVIGA